jgi:hypothetical protein
MESLSKAECTKREAFLSTLMSQTSVTRFGRISPFGSQFTLRSFYENYRCSANNWPTFFNSESCVLFFTQNGLGESLGDLFKYASGHPVTD